MILERGVGSQLNDQPWSTWREFLGGALKKMIATIALKSYT
jgi:hypothetical protein